jgi:hypothetical protein
VTVVFAGLREHVKDSRSLRLDFEKEGIRVINVQADSRYDSLFVRKVERVLHSERPDILHTYLPRADLPVGLRGVLILTQFGFVRYAICGEDWSGRWTPTAFSIQFVA